MKKIKITIFLIIIFLTGGVKGESTISIDIRATKLMYDGKRDKIYAIVNGMENSFVQINPYTGMIERSIFVGSEPSCMDITKDTNFVYIGLDGASFIKRIDLNLFQVDQSITLPNGFYGPIYAKF